jgi:hypothetical protein
MCQEDISFSLDTFCMALNICSAVCFLSFDVENRILGPVAGVNGIDETNFG